jgi:hypothetical protein
VRCSLCVCRAIFRQQQCQLLVRALRLCTSCLAKHTYPARFRGVLAVAPGVDALHKGACARCALERHHRAGEQEAPPKAGHPRLWFHLPWPLPRGLERSQRRCAHGRTEGPRPPGTTRPCAAVPQLQQPPPHRWLRRKQRTHRPWLMKAAARLSSLNWQPLQACPVAAMWPRLQGQRIATVLRPVRAVPDWRPHR